MGAAAVVVAARTVVGAAWTVGVVGTAWTVGVVGTAWTVGVVGTVVVTRAVVVGTAAGAVVGVVETAMATFV